jgi:hypothetical protein
MDTWAPKDAVDGGGDKNADDADEDIDDEENVDDDEDDDDDEDEAHQPDHAPFPALAFSALPNAATASMSSNEAGADDDDTAAEFRHDADPLDCTLCANDSSKCA